MQFLGVFVLAQLGERLGFDLTDTLARNGEFLTDFLERVTLATVQAEAHLDDFLLAIGQRLEDRLDLLF